MASTGSLPCNYSILSIRSATISQNSLLFLAYLLQCQSKRKMYWLLHDFPISILHHFQPCLTVETFYFLSWCRSVCDCGVCDPVPPFLAFSYLFFMKIAWTGQGYIWIFFWSDIYSPSDLLSWHLRRAVKNRDPDLRDLLLPSLKYLHMSWEDGLVYLCT